MSRTEWFDFEGIVEDDTGCSLTGLGPLAVHELWRSRPLEPFESALPHAEQIFGWQLGLLVLTSAHMWDTETPKQLEVEEFTV